MSEEVVPIQLKYGRNGNFRVELLERQLMFHHRAPAAMTSAASQVAQALESPLDFPELERTFVPGDRAAVVVEVDTPDADIIFESLWKKMESAGVRPEDVTIVQPASWKRVEGIDPRARLQPGVKEVLKLHRHDPLVEDSCGYLASTAGNERIYMSREILDADVVVTIGPAEFDPVLGVRGTTSALYPGLSDLETLQRVRGQGHEELSPDDPRPLRQVVDEIGWLLGTQLSVAVIPSGGKGAHAVLAGLGDSVLRQAREALNATWYVRTGERAELVLVTVPQDASGHGWEQVAAAIDVGRRLVERNGRIVVLSELDAPPGEGLEILKTVREPRDALKLIQKAQTPDMLTALRIANATDWANVSLLSKLDPTVVSDLFMLPLENEREVKRLLESEDVTAVIEAGQHTFVISGV